VSHKVIERTVAEFGAVDALVVNHAHSSDQSLATATVEQLDRAWPVNARAAVLLAQAFAASHEDAVNPSPVDTGWPSPELREELTARFPAGRWGRPEDIAPVVAWLLSADSAWVTGQVIDVEGGFRR
jgi:3-oxoacyl-[acyl-carrier protein] reductase